MDTNGNAVHMNPVHVEIFMVILNTFIQFTLSNQPSKFKKRDMEMKRGMKAPYELSIQKYSKNTIH